MISRDLRRLFSKLAPACTRLFEGAVGACVQRTHHEVTVAHLLGQMVEDDPGDAPRLFEAAGIDRARLRIAVQDDLRQHRTGNASRPVFSPALLELLERAWAETSINLEEDRIRGAAILLALGESLHLAPAELHDLLRPLRAERLRADLRRLLADSAESLGAQPRAGEATSHGATTGRAGGTPGASVLASGSKAPATGTPSALAPESALARFTVDFTELARQGKIDPVFGRDDEIRQAVDILSRRRKNNPIFIGEAGVGKTAVVEGLALRIVQGDVPAVLRDVRLLALDLGLLSAGAGVRGEFENRIKSVVAEVKESASPIVLFIDEAHTLIGAGGEAGKNDAANLLKPELARGEMKCIAATTFTEFRKYLEKDPAIARRFQPVVIAEPDPATAATMLRGLRERYEAFHGVRISHEAVRAACDLSHRYVASRQLPDKAVDLLDTAAARVKMGLTTRPAELCRIDEELLDLRAELASLERDAALPGATAPQEAERLRRRCGELQELATALEERWKLERAKVEEILAATDSAQIEELHRELAALQGERPLVHPFVTPAVLAQVVEEWTGIPAGDMVRDEARMLLGLEDTLNRRVIGQSWGIRELATTIRAARMGLTRPETPKGVFLLAGPSGVGKTETAKAIADLLYGGESAVVTLSMSEYQDAISVTQLKGASAGYVGYGDGGVLTEGVRRHPHTVVILDEIEKAHRDVLDMFYQVFDQGTLRDGEGRDIGFRDTVIVMTSNLGTETITRMALDAETSYAYPEYVEAIVPELTAHFQPALLARCKVVPFLPLGADSLRDIVVLKLDRIARRLAARHGVELACTEALVDRIVSRCTLVQSGARLIDTVLDRDLLPGISALLLGRIAEGGAQTRLVVGLGDDGSPFFAFADQEDLSAEPAAGTEMALPAQGLAPAGDSTTDRGATAREATHDPATVQAASSQDAIGIASTGQDAMDQTATRRKGAGEAGAEDAA